MKHSSFFLSLVVTAIITTSCNNASTSNKASDSSSSTSTTVTESTSAPEMDASLQKSELDFLKAYHSKYPYDVKLLDNEIIKKRLIALLGKAGFDEIKQWTTEMPIEVNGDMVTVSACKPHDCSENEYLMTADTKADQIVIGVRKAGKATLYNEANAPTPKVLADWPGNK